MGRRVYWTSWIRQDKKSTLPWETSIWERGRDSSACSPLTIWSLLKISSRIEGRSEGSRTKTTFLWFVSYMYLLLLLLLILLLLLLLVFLLLLLLLLLSIKYTMYIAILFYFTIFISGFSLVPVTLYSHIEKNLAAQVWDWPMKSPAIELMQKWEWILQLCSSVWLWDSFFNTDQFVILTFSRLQHFPVKARIQTCVTRHFPCERVCRVTV